MVVVRCESYSGVKLVRRWMLEWSNGMESGLKVKLTIKLFFKRVTIDVELWVLVLVFVKIAD